MVVLIFLIAFLILYFEFYGNYVECYCTGEKKAKKKKKAKQKTAMSITGITLLDLYDFVNIFP